MSGTAELDPQLLAEIDELENFQAGARAEVVRLFSASIARDLARLSDALYDGDASASRTTLHSLKGCALGIGARRLARVAAMLEGLARAGEVGAIAIRADELREACDEADRALQAWAGGGASR